MGGCKGVLVASKNKFWGECKVKIRKSMKKFDQNKDDSQLDLDVIRMATYSHGYLNKQIISILWSNGVEPEVFIEMQSKYVKDIINIFNLEKLYSFDSTKSFMLFSSIKYINYKLFSLRDKMPTLFLDPFIGPLFKLV